ncbi:hypothetical protein K5I29_01600 [Flavobacterium agricola]|uniref:Uncharacterized protein n=1 Tax=Flavobacterium agricola TaxID=2870839 RepID=A0ABY6M1G2_9FLAO|nr:hypothetical protein [Flavobacterium agricola]UYW01647.1 hypothetical protein K5I29_01600 [Flavobacterium agricola]
MNRILKLIIFTIFIQAGIVYGQVGINTTNPKATLEVAHDLSNTKVAPGIIAPKLTLQELITKSDLYGPEQKGTIIYVSDVENAPEHSKTKFNGIESDGYYYFNGISWELFVSTQNIEIPEEPWKADVTGVDATTFSENIVHGGQVGLGFQKQINNAAQLEIDSADKGILLPRMTTKQRDEITNVPNSLLIFNTDTDCFNFYKNNRWRSLCGDIGTSEIIVANCNSVEVYGDYQVGKAMDAGNYLQITLNVVEPGDYSILVSNPSLGYFFERSGRFPNAGNYLIQLPATGTPRNPGTDSLNITINDEEIACKATVEVKPASVSFQNIRVIHADELVRGESSRGKTITMLIDVVNPGNFSFQTTTVNGLNYGLFDTDLTTGNNIELKLSANGNPPAQAGVFNYPITGTGIIDNPVEATVNVLENDAKIGNISCDAGVVAGTYRLDSPLTATHYIDIPVTSTSAGNYNITITSDTNPGFSFSGSGTFTGANTQNIRVYGTGTPTSAGRIPFTVTVNGVSCNININVVIPTKSILVAGTASARILSALRNTQNFGPNGKSKIESINIFNTTPNATQLRDYINNRGVQVILIGWSWNPNDEIIGVLVDFIKNKKGFVYWVESQDDQNFIKKLLNQTYDANVTTTEDEYSIYTSVFDSSIPDNNPFMNGVFGNAKGKLLRADDYSSWLGIEPATLPSSLNGLIHLPRNGSQPERKTMIFGEGFFMNPDWGNLNYANNQYFGNPSPISVGTGTFNGYYNYDGTSVAIRNINNQDVYNWIIFGNAMDYIFQYVHENFKN